MDSVFARLVCYCPLTCRNDGRVSGHYIVYTKFGHCETIVASQSEVYGSLLQSRNSPDFICKSTLWSLTSPGFMSGLHVRDCHQASWGKQVTNQLLLVRQRLPQLEPCSSLATQPLRKWQVQDVSGILHKHDVFCFSIPPALGRVCSKQYYHSCLSRDHKNKYLSSLVQWTAAKHCQFWASNTVITFIDYTVT